MKAARTIPVAQIEAAEKVLTAARHLLRGTVRHPKTYMTRVRSSALVGLREAFEAWDEAKK